MCEVLLQERKKQERKHFRRYRSYSTSSNTTFVKLHPNFFRLEDPNLPFPREKQLCVYIKKFWKICEICGCVERKNTNT